MREKLDIQLFIEQHSDWENILSEKPYCLAISRTEWNGKKLVMLKYNQIESDFNEKIVRQCRGIILDEDTNEVISYPFEKFGNVSEGSWVESIDWSKKPYVLTKVDGSLIKIVKVNSDLLISTNGTILADEANIAEQIGCKAKSFGDLVNEGLTYYSLDRTKLADILEEGFTYMFELTSPWNKVVVPYKESKLWFIGVRNNKTFEESFIKDHPLAKVFDTPELHEFDTFENCIETAKNLPWDNEGYVITSRDFKRNKAKSLGYLACHHLKNNGIMSYDRAIELVRLNEVDEVCSYFPEFREGLDDVKSKYDKLIAELEAAWDLFNAESMNLTSRKDQAIWIQKHFKVTGIGFCLLDKKVNSVKEWFETVPTSYVVKALGLK